MVCADNRFPTECVMGETFKQEDYGLALLFYSPFFIAIHDQRKVSTYVQELTVSYLTLPD